MAVVMDYRTRDGLADYSFSIEFESDVGWRVYIVFQPLYQGNDDNAKLRYQATDRGGRSYVDWPVKLDHLGDAKTVAERWADHVWEQLMWGGNDATKYPDAKKRRKLKVAGSPRTIPPDSRRSPPGP